MRLSPAVQVAIGLGGTTGALLLVFAAATLSLVAMILLARLAHTVR